MQSNRKFYYPLQADGDSLPAEETFQENNKSSNSEDESAPDVDKVADEQDEHKASKTSLRDALQEWSNDNERDIEEDDATPLRSGL